MKLKSLFPQQADFFSMFESLTDQALGAAKCFETLVNDLSKAETIAREIDDYEHKADLIVHSSIVALHKTFITPMDRTNIHNLLMQLDDVLDLLNGAAQRIHLFRLSSILPETKVLALLTVESVRQCHQLMHSLDELKNVEGIGRISVAINKTENDADRAMHQAMSQLFEKENDFKSFIKEKELIEILELVTDRVEDVAHLVETILIDHA